MDSTAEVMMPQACLMQWLYSSTSVNKVMVLLLQ